NGLAGKSVLLGEHLGDGLAALGLRDAGEVDLGGRLRRRMRLARGHGGRGGFRCSRCGRGGGFLLLCAAGERGGDGEGNQAAGDRLEHLITPRVSGVPRVRKSNATETQERRNGSAATA